MGLFFPSSKSKRTVKDLEREKFRGSGDHDMRTSDAMEAIQNDPRIHSVLNTRQERDEFFAKLEEVGHDRRGVTADELMQVLSEMRSNKRDHLDKYEVNKLGEALGLSHGEIHRMQRMSATEERPKIEPRSAEDILDHNDEK